MKNPDKVIHVAISRGTAIKRISEAMEKLDDDRVLHTLYRELVDSRTPFVLAIDGVKKAYSYGDGPQYIGDIKELDQ